VSVGRQARRLRGLGPRKWSDPMGLMSDETGMSRPKILFDRTWDSDGGESDAEGGKAEKPTCVARMLIRSPICGMTCSIWAQRRYSTEVP